MQCQTPYYLIGNQRIMISQCFVFYIELTLIKIIPTLTKNPTNPLSGFLYLLNSHPALRFTPHCRLQTTNLLLPIFILTFPSNSQFIFINLSFLKKISQYHLY